jgi:hypothetical protein
MLKLQKLLSKKDNEPTKRFDSQTYRLSEQQLSSDLKFQCRSLWGIYWAGGRVAKWGHFTEWLKEDHSEK